MRQRNRLNGFRRSLSYFTWLKPGVTEKDSIQKGFAAFDVPTPFFGQSSPKPIDETDMGLDILAGLIVWWLAGAFASYLLLMFYENIRPSDATKKLDEQEKKDIRKAMAKLAVQTGLITAIVWLMVRLKSFQGQ